MNLYSLKYSRQCWYITLLRMVLIEKNFSKTSLKMISRKTIKTSSDWLRIFSVESSVDASVDGLRCVNSDASVDGNSDAKGDATGPKMYYSGSNYSSSTTPPSVRKYSTNRLVNLFGVCEPFDGKTVIV